MTLPAVLLIDDDPQVLRSLVRTLNAPARTRARLLTATSRDEALACLEREPDIKVVVSDHDLGPGPSGVALLGEVRERWPGCRRILVSGSTTAEGGAALIASQTVHGFVEKPWDPAELWRAIERASRPDLRGRA